MPLGGATGGILMGRKRLERMPAAARDLVMKVAGEQWGHAQGRFSSGGGLA